MIKQGGCGLSVWMSLGWMEVWMQRPTWVWLWNAVATEVPKM